MFIVSSGKSIEMNRAKRNEFPTFLLKGRSLTVFEVLIEARYRGHKSETYAYSGATEWFLLNKGTRSKLRKFAEEYVNRANRQHEPELVQADCSDSPGGGDDQQMMEEMCSSSISNIVGSDLRFQNPAVNVVPHHALCHLVDVEESPRTAVTPYEARSAVGSPSASNAPSESDVVQEGINQQQTVSCTCFPSYSSACHSSIHLNRSYSFL